MSPPSKDQYLACIGISFEDIDSKLVTEGEGSLDLHLCMQLSMYHKGCLLINRKIHSLSARNETAYSTLTKQAMTI